MVSHLSNMTNEDNLKISMKQNAIKKSISNRIKNEAIENKYIFIKYGGRCICNIQALVSRFKLLFIFLTAISLFISIPPLIYAEKVEFTILSTNDLHSHFEGSGPQSNLQESRGHFARIAYILRHLQDNSPNSTLTLDAGDWFCGSMFSMIGISYMFPHLIPELQFLKYARYDATTIGNHEMIDKNAEFGWIMEKYWKSTKDPVFYGIPRTATFQNSTNGAHSPSKELQQFYTEIINMGQSGSSPILSRSLKSRPKEKKLLNRLEREQLQEEEGFGEYLLGNVPVLSTNTNFVEKCAHLNSYATWGIPSTDIRYRYSTPSPDDNEPILFHRRILKKIKSASSDSELKVGIFSSYGVNSADISQTTRQECMTSIGFNDKTKSIEWNNYVEFIYDTAIKLQEKDGAEFVILIAHEGEPYNTRLIKSLKKLSISRRGYYKPVINVLIAAHTHDAYSKKVQGVQIIQAGKNGEYVGVLHLSFDKELQKLSILNPISTTPLNSMGLNGRSAIDLPQLLSIDASIPFDTNVYYMVEYYKGIIDNFFLKNMPFNYGDVLGHLDTSVMARKGDLTQYIANCIHTEVDRDQSILSEPAIDVYYLGNALVRHNPDDILFSRNLTFSDVQRILGYGAMTSHLTSENIWRSFGDRIAHFYLSVDDFLKVEEARMYASWVKKKYMFFASTNKLQHSLKFFGIPFYNRLSIYDEEGRCIRNSKRLIHIAISQSALVFFKRFSEYTLGFINPILRDRYGRPMSESEIDRQEYVLLAQCIQKR